MAELPRPVGYVLGSGGSLGAVHVGMLRTLDERDIALYIVTYRDGNSLGSLNGAVIALDPGRTDRAGISPGPGLAISPASAATNPQAC